MSSLCLYYYYSKVSWLCQALVTCCNNDSEGAKLEVLTFTQMMIQFVSMRLVGLAPTLLPTLLKSRLVCVNHVPNHSQFLEKYIHVNHASYLLVTCLHIQRLLHLITCNRRREVHSNWCIIHRRIYSFKNLIC